jgi:hypothetical protein
MRTKSGLHPYDLGLLFILRGCGKKWPLRSISQVSGWSVTRLLAHAFDKRPADVAKELIDLQVKLEDGEHEHERQRQHDPAA